MADPRAPGPLAIERCVSAYQRVQHALTADDELAADEAPLADIYAADPNILPPEELLRRFVAAIAFAESRATEAKVFAAGMAKRAQRYAGRADAMRSELLEIMLALERSSFTGSPFGTVSVKRGIPSPVVTDEKMLPAEYWRARDPEVDRTKLGSALKALLADEIIPGAVLSNPMPVLAIKYAKATPEPEDDD